ncbi:hypothetical protein Tco_0710958 [Tanacetum coccineum]
MKSRQNSLSINQNWEAQNSYHWRPSHFYFKSVLTAIPIYHMSLFKVPAGILKDMESIRRNFFNGIDKSERKMVWIGWDNILASKKNGGLGVSSLYATNQINLKRSNNSALSDVVSDLILPQMQDRWTWSLNASGNFSVSSVRNVIDDVYLPKLDVPTRWVRRFLSRLIF